MKQLLEWYAFDRIEPIGPEADYQGAAIVASTLANINRDSKKRKEPFSIADFIPSTFMPEIKQKKLSPEELAKSQMEFFRRLVARK